MNCPKCNAQIDDNAEVCTSCGEPLDTEEIQFEEDKNAKLEELKARRLKKKRNKQRKKIILVCLIIAIILGAVGYGVYKFSDVFDRTNVNNDIVIVSPSPVATQEPTPEPSPEATPSELPEESATPEAEEVTPVVTPDASWVAIETPKPAAATKKPTATAKPSKPAAAAPAPTIAPVVSSPGFVAGSVAQNAVPQGSAISSTLVTVTSVETAPYSGKSIIKFNIGNQSYYAYADSANFDKGIPAMYSIDAVATADVYYGLPVYSVTKIDSYAADGYILPQSSTQLLTEADLAGLSKAQLDLARNEIFARHGRVFKRQEVQKYFESKTWYKKNSSYNYSNDYVNLSDTELKNAKFILAYENK